MLLTPTKKVNAVRAVLEASGETKFEEAWKKSTQGAVELEPMTLCFLVNAK